MYDDRGLEDVADVMFMGRLGRQCPRLSRLSDAARDPEKQYHQLERGNRRLSSYQYDGQQGLAFGWHRSTIMMLVIVMVVMVLA